MADDKVNIEASPLNGEDGKPPYGFFNPQLEDRLQWICNYDDNRRIVSIFRHKNDDGTFDRQVGYLQDEAEAMRYRDELVANGWKPLKPPKITVKQPDGSDRPLNRQQRRILQRTAAREMKKASASDYLGKKEKK